MPTYPALKTYRGGFYNNHVVNGQDDRVYTAEDVRKPYDTVFTDGILPEADGTPGECLKVSATGGMGISVASGHAKLGGAWFENERLYNITLDVSGASDRYDCVIVRNDDSDNVREPSIYIKSLSAVPTASDLTRDDDVYEICVAYIKVVALVESISNSDIFDTRVDGSLCNVMSGVGATVVRTYRNTYFSETLGQTVIPIGISQYNKTKDTLTVIIEGRTFTEGTNYTINDNSKITLAIGLPVVGTKIEFEVAKNVNAAGAETVIQEVAEIRKEMTVNNKKLEHHYYCNGTNDNVLISQIAQTYITGGSDYGSMKLVIHGHFGAVAPYAGAGTSSDRYQWFITGRLSSPSTRKLILDFSDCGEIALPITEGTYNDIFSGYDANVVGANVIVNNPVAIVRIFNSVSGAVNCENCRFWITANRESYISRTGTFTNCRGSVANSFNYSYCFYTGTNGLIRVIGGEYYAYTADSTAESAVLYQTGENAVSILYGVNCPTVARSGYYQKKAIAQSAGDGILSCTDIVSTLPISVASGISNIRGTIAINKPGLM